jgi:hypothetical protein
MKLNELIEIEKALRELVYFQPGPTNSPIFFNKQNDGAKALGCLVYEIKKHSKEINVEIENE